LRVSAIAKAASISFLLVSCPKTIRFNLSGYGCIKEAIQKVNREILD
jgi:hypothetical protein